MPSLKHLLEDLRRLNVDPDDIRVSGQIYDDLVEQGEDIEENPDDE